MYLMLHPNNIDDINIIIGINYKNTNELIKEILSLDYLFIVFQK